MKIVCFKQMMAVGCLLVFSLTQTSYGTKNIEEEEDSFLSTIRVAYSEKKDNYDLASLGFNPEDEEHWKSLATFVKDKNIEQLSLKGLSSYPTNGFQHLLNENIKALDLSDSLIGDDLLKFIPKTVQLLNISRTYIGGAGLFFLNENPSIKKVNVAGCTIPISHFKNKLKYDLYKDDKKVIRKSF